MSSKNPNTSSASINLNEEIITSEDEAEIWQLPEPGSWELYGGNWGKVKQVKMKNLFIGFICMIYPFDNIIKEN